MGEVLKYPTPEYILTCKHCRSNAFYIWLGSPDPDDYDQYECANEDCGALFNFIDLECAVDDN
jgi:hypothetical protein